MTEGHSTSHGLDFIMTDQPGCGNLESQLGKNCDQLFQIMDLHKTYFFSRTTNTVLLLLK